MRRIAFIICIAVMMFVPAASQALSGGIGAYGSFSYGHSYWDFKTKKGYVAADDKDEKHRSMGYGILADTAVARDSLLNYRLGIGCESVIHSFHDGDFGDLELRRIILSATLGIGIIRSDDLRFWIGPQLRLSYGWGEASFHQFFAFSGPGAPITNLNAEYEYKVYRTDLGIASGLNIHIPGNLSLGLECGWRAFLGKGERRIERNIVDYAYGLNSSLRKTEELKYLYGFEPFVSACIMYRIHDEYKFSNALSAPI